MRRILAVIFSVLMIISVLSTFAIAVEPQSDIVLYVSPDGIDSAKGTQEEPMSLTAAKEYLKGKKEEASSATVYLMGGTYILTDTLEFTEEDMGNVIYCAFENQEVIFSGATPITGFTEDTANGVKVFKTTVDVSSEDKIFKTLFSDTRVLTTPRYPESGYFTVTKLAPEDDLWTEDNTPWPYTRGSRSFYASTSDIKHDFHNMTDVNIRILHYWHDELMNVTSYNKSNGKIGLSRPSSMLITEGDRYYFENVFEELDSPCEWYLDTKTGELYYVPVDGEIAEDLTLYSSVNNKLITINGVSALSFQGIRFTRTDWEFPTTHEMYKDDWTVKNNIDFPQAALFVDGAVEVDYAEDIHFTNCEFTDLGGTAIKLRYGVRNSSIENCYFENIAATAIFVGGMNYYPENIEYTSNITIRNNEIYKYGRKFHCAIGIHITYCDTAIVQNNEIHDGFYTGISVGWTWGYAYHSTKNITINRNLIYNIGQGWLSDMGGIYMLGRQPGTTISENVIHNVAADPGEGGYGGWGIYLDEGSSFMIVEKNLVYSCGNQSFNTHYGEGNIIRNNIAAFSGEGLVSTGIIEENHATAYYYNNIFITKDKAPIYINMMDTAHFYDNGNLMWSITEGEELYCIIWDSPIPINDAIKQGFINDVTIADPLFKDAENFDVTLHEKSPAFEMNFEAWDYSLAGTIKGTIIGLNKQGGLTAYNDEAAHQPVYQFPGVSIDNKIPLIASIIAIPLLVLWLIVCIIKCRKSYIMPLLSSMLAVVLIPAIYDNYIAWTPTFYFPLVFLLGAAAAIVPATTSNLKGRSRKRVTLIFILNFLLSSGLFLGLAGIFNMLLSAGTPPVIGLAILAMIIYMVINTIILLVHIRKKNIEAKMMFDYFDTNDVPDEDTEEAIEEPSVKKTDEHAEAPETEETTI